MQPADPAPRQSNTAGTEATQTSPDPDATSSGEDHAEPTTPASGGGTWTFLSNHAHVLLCLAADPHQTLPMIAEQVGITTRAVQLILADLIEGGYVERTKVGRRNHYRINPDGRLRHPLEAHHCISDLITALGPTTPGSGEIAVDAAADSGRAQRAG